MRYSPYACEKADSWKYRSPGVDSYEKEHVQANCKARFHWFKSKASAFNWNAYYTDVDRHQVQMNCYCGVCTHVVNRLIERSSRFKTSHVTAENQAKSGKWIFLQNPVCCRNDCLGQHIVRMLSFARENGMNITAHLFHLEHEWYNIV